MRGEGQTGTEVKLKHAICNLDKKKHAECDA